MEQDVYSVTWSPPRDDATTKGIQEDPVLSYFCWTSLARESLGGGAGMKEHEGEQAKRLREGVNLK